MAKYDLTGKVFNKLKVICYDKTRRNTIYWKVLCDCGSYSSTTTYKLLSGIAKSCGCMRGGVPVHGMSQKRIYKIWLGVKKRCNGNKEHYGSSGVTYDSRWESFKNFYDDMVEGYSDNLTLDRIDPSGSYCKDNCRWVTMREQNLNKRVFGKSKMNHYGIRKIKNKGVETFTAKYYKDGDRVGRSFSCNKYGEDVALFLARKFVVEGVLSGELMEYNRYVVEFERFVGDYGVLNLFCSGDFYNVNKSC